ncbi:MAG TPA: HAD-IB family hydrolase [Acidimicrobiales bacterium]
MEAAFFDLDKTVIAKASMVAFGGSFYREGLISRRLVLRALWGQLVYMHLGASEEKLARMRESVLALTKGWEKARIEAIVAEALEAVVEPIIYAEAAELIDRHRADGRLVVIVSASPEEIVSPLGRFLRVDEVIASRAQLDDDGRYTGEMEFYAYGPYKAEAMRALADERGIDLEASFAYSDSATDLPMLEVVGHPVVVNPDRVLARIAKDREWEVRTFARPVRLRDRVPVPPAAPTAIGAAVAGAAAGGFVWWRLRKAEQAARLAAEARRSRVPLGPPAAAAAAAIRSAASSRRWRRGR